MHLVTPLLAAFLAWGLGFLWAVPRRRGWVGGLAAAFVLWPAARVVARIVLDLRRTVTLIATPTTVEPLATEVLWDIVTSSAQRHLILPVIGILILVLQRPLARDPELGRPSAALGLLPLALVAEALAVFIATGPGAFANTGDTASALANASWHLAFLVAVVPAFAEEVAYRGALYPLLRDWMGRRWALGLQAVLFGLAHAGWGDVQRLLAPFVLGLFNGWLVDRMGLWGPIVVHAGLNLAFFALTETADPMVFRGLVLGLGLAMTPWAPRAIRQALGRAREGPRGS